MEHSKNILTRVFKGIGIAFVQTFIMCLIGYLLLELYI